MKTTEAIEICEQWFAYIERQKQRSIEMQKLATMARNGQQAEAQKRMRQMDRSVTVYDGATLEPAVRHLVKLAELEQRIANVERAAARGLCVTHHWGAPPGKDDLPCPYCIGLWRGR